MNGGGEQMDEKKRFFRTTPSEDEKRVFWLMCLSHLFVRRGIITTPEAFTLQMEKLCPEYGASLRELLPALALARAKEDGESPRQDRDVGKSR